MVGSRRFWLGLGWVALLTVLLATAALGKGNFNTQNIIAIKQAGLGKDYQFSVFGQSGGKLDALKGLMTTSKQMAKPQFHLLLGGNLPRRAKSAADFSPLLETLSELGVPAVLIPGKTELTRKGVDAFKEAVGEPETAFTAGGIKFIILNDAGGAIQDSSLSFLEQQLAQANEMGVRKIVLLHQAPAVGDWAKMSKLSRLLIKKNADRLHQILVQGQADYVVAGSPGIFAYQFVDGVRYLITGGAKVDKGLVPSDRNKWWKKLPMHGPDPVQVWGEGPHFTAFRYYDGLLNHLMVPASGKPLTPPSEEKTAPEEEAPAPPEEEGEAPPEEPAPPPPGEEPVF